MEDDDSGSWSDASVDASSLAGTGEYSATGGGTQPLHDPRGTVEEDDDLDGDSMREMYRDSLARATQDPPRLRRVQWVDGPLHLERSSRRGHRRR